MQLLVTALASHIDASVDGGPAVAPAEIVYIPDGESVITPSVNGKPKKVTIRLNATNGPKVAAKFQADLEKRIAEAKESKTTFPWFDFNHAALESSAEPTAFRYEEGKGLITPLIWSASGRAAVEGRNLRYFSPTFLLADDGTPAGLPDKGPLGALVPEPAFRNIGAIAAADAEDDLNNPNPTNQNSNMKAILAHFKIDESRTDAESLVLQKVTASDVEKNALETKITELERQLAALKLEKESLETKAADSRKAEGEALFNEAVAAGLVVAKDETSKSEYIAACADENVFAIKIIKAGIESAKKSKPALNRSVIAAGATNDSTGGDFESKAKALVAAKEAATLDEAFSIVAASDPELYTEYQASLA